MRNPFFATSICLAMGLGFDASEKVPATFSGKVPATFSAGGAGGAWPGGGIQPQAVVDASDVIHVVFFSGQPAGGDLYYVKLAADGHRLSQPVRVNSIAGSALATGSVRGAQLSLGRNGFVHVAWHGSKAAGDATS